MNPQTKKPLPAGAAETAKIIPLPIEVGRNAAATAKAETTIITNLLADVVSDTLELKDYLTYLIEQDRFAAPSQKYLKVTGRHRQLTSHGHWPCSQTHTKVDPEIRIAGQWLYKIGFTPEQYAKITSIHGMIIIFPVAKPPAQ